MTQYVNRIMTKWTAPRLKPGYVPQPAGLNSPAYCSQPRCTSCRRRWRFFEIVLQHLLAIAVADTLIDLTVDGQFCLCNQLLIITVFRFDVVFDGMTVKTVRQRDVDSEVFKRTKQRSLSGAQLIA